MENHEPMTAPIGKYLSVKPEERDGRLYLPDVEGSPIRLDLERLEHDQILEGIQYFYASTQRRSFAVRAAY